jgi:hypothetical protein
MLATRRIPLFKPLLLAINLTLAWICAAATASESQHPRNVDVGTRVVAYIQGGTIPAVIHAEKLTHLSCSTASISIGSTRDRASRGSNIVTPIRVTRRAYTLPNLLPPPIETGMPR